MNKPRPRTESELIELLRASDVRAPETLHRYVREVVDGHTPVARRRWAGVDRLLGAGGSAAGRRLAGALVVTAVVVAALAVALAGGGSSALSLNEASALTLRPATMVAPAENSTHPAQLAAAVDGVAFPYWEEHFGWRSTGMRTDRMDGRAVTTVFYSDSRGRRIGYAIVSGTPALAGSGGTIARHDGVSYRLLLMHGAAVVTWQRDGRLCVLSGKGVSGRTLLALAGWSDRGAAPA
ncbi:MAG: hypothetical protein ACRDK7_10355 [Solirubrobacteraceae bacterium]